MSQPPEIVPFWNRLRAISLYPLRGGALASLLVFTVGQLALGWLPLVGALLWLGAFRYAFEVLLASANGRLEPPEVLQSSDGALTIRYVGLQVLTVLVPLAIAVLLNPGLGIAAFIALVLVQPAAIMGLALTGSLVRAMDPNLWLAVIGRVGWPYLALIGLLLVIQFSATNAGSLLQVALPDWLAQGLTVMLSLWSLFATFHLMGYLVYQYHEAFGFEPKVLHDSRPALHDPDRDLLAQAGDEIQSGNAEAARQLLRSEMRSRAVGMEVQELYRRVLQQLGQQDELQEHSRLYVHQLLIEKQYKRALEIAREAIQSSPGFIAMEPEQNVLLAERARFSGQSRLAIDLLAAAINDGNRHPDKPRWALQASELLERFPDSGAESRRLLEKALQRCDDADWRRRLETQLEALGA